MINDSLTLEFYHLIHNIIHNLHQFSFSNRNKFCTTKTQRHNANKHRSIKRKRCKSLTLGSNNIMSYQYCAHSISSAACSFCPRRKNHRIGADAFSRIALLLACWLLRSQAQELLFRPELYHGNGKTSRFFEGWYHKLVQRSVVGKKCKDQQVCSNDNHGSLSMAVVPGVFFDSGHQSTNESHAFIFLNINGEKQHYYRFDLETELDYFQLGGEEEPGYYIKIGNNTFSRDGMVLDLHPRSGNGHNDDASVSIQGSVYYFDLSPWPIPSVWNLGAMGPVGTAPFLECYHDVLSFDHRLEGKLKVVDSLQQRTEEIILDRSTSRGYVEKDRGRSFPSLWIWMQTNSFAKKEGTSLFFSVARIPLLVQHQQHQASFSLLNWCFRFLPQLEFPGFTAAVWLNENGKQLIPFATWSGAYFEELVVDEESLSVTIHSGGIGKRTTNDGSSLGLRATRYIKAWIGSWFLDYDSKQYQYRLELKADRRVPHVMLYGPKTSTNDGSSKMEPFVNEALQSSINVRLLEYFWEDGIQHERLLLEDIGEHAGLEVHQNVQYLVDNLCGKQGILACL